MSIASLQRFGTSISPKKPVENNLLNLQNLVKPTDVRQIAERVFQGVPHRLAVVGYYTPPTDTYSNKVTSFLNALVDNLGVKKSGIITTPSADAGSVDSLGTMISQDKGVPILYLTTESYGHGLGTEKFPKSVDLEKYSKIPKYLLPDGDSYSKATAEAASSLVVLGGRKDTIREFENTIKTGKKAIVVVDSSIGGAWDTSKTRAENAGKYIFEQFQAVKQGKNPPNPDTGSLTETLKSYRSEIERNVLFVDVDKDGYQKGAKKAADFLKK